MLHLKAVLDDTELAHAREALAGADWEDGRVTSGSLPGSIKRNGQLPQQAPLAQHLQQLVLHALRRNQLFFSAALPRHIAPPMFSRYDGERQDYLDKHVDVALRYLPDGSSAGSNLTVSICSPAGVLLAQVIVNNIGRPRSERPKTPAPCPA